jgi:hypothetical protein
LMNIFKTPLKLEVAQQCQLTLKVTSQRFWEAEESLDLLHGQMPKFTHK